MKVGQLEEIIKWPHLQKRDKSREWKTDSLDGDSWEERAEAVEEGGFPAREGVSLAPPAMLEKNNPTAAAEFTFDLGCEFSFYESWFWSKYQQENKGAFPTVDCKTFPKNKI